MFQFLQVNFNVNSQPHIPEQNSFLWDLSKDFILPILLGVAAAIVAYRIFVGETRRELKLELRRKNQERSDKLLFFAFLVEGCLRAARQQKDHLKELLKKIRENDLEFHYLSFVPLNDLTRLSKELVLENYLLAYTDRFPENRTQSIREFNDIIESADYLLASFNQIVDQLQKSQAYDFERKKKYMVLFSEASSFAGRITAAHRPHNDEIHNALSLLSIQYMQNYAEETNPLQYHNDSFFIPVNDFCTVYSEQHPPNPEIIELGFLTRDGRQAFLEIKAQYQAVREDLLVDVKTIIRTINTLEKSSTRLLQELETQNQ